MLTHRSFLRAGRVLAAAALTIALAACSDTTDGAGSAPASTESAAAVTEQDSVTLIDPGEEPRAQLRYDFADGQAISGTVRQTETLNQIIDGQSKGESSVTSLFDFGGSVETDGHTMTLHYTIENARIGDDTDPDVAQAASQGISAINGAGIITTMDSRGQIIDNTFELSDRLQEDPGAVSMFESLEQGALSTPLPEEPVGVGARWSSMQGGQDQGITIMQTTESELRSVTGSVLEIASTVTQHARSSPATLDTGQSESAAIEISVWNITAEGTSLLDLTNPVPTAVVRTRGRQDMTFTVDGQSTRLEQAGSSELELTPN